MYQTYCHKSGKTIYPQEYISEMNHEKKCWFMNLLKFLIMIVKLQINVFGDFSWHKNHLHSVKKY